MDLTALTAVCFLEWWGWDGRLPLFPAAREGMVPMAVSHLLHWYDLTVAGRRGGTTSTHFVDLLQHNTPISKRARGSCFSECEELLADEHYIWVPGRPHRSPH